MKPQRLAVTFAAALALIAPTPAQAATPGDHAETQSVLNNYQAKLGPGAAVYAGDSTSSWNLHSGSASITATRPIEPSDHFRIASQTKTFTAAVVLQLVDEGRVDLDTAIERYLPGVVAGNGYDGNKITVRQLLQHTSGIGSPPITAYLKPTNPDGTFTLQDLVRIGLTAPPQFEPGTSWAYSNVNYYVAGLLIERIAGTTAPDAITSRIIRPLGLTQTKFPPAGEKTMATPYVPGYRGVRSGPFFFWTETTSGFPGLNIDVVSTANTAGAIVSTLTDVTAFYQALLNGRVVSAHALAEMRRTVPVPGGLPGYGYGLGLALQPLSCGGVAWGHPGNLPTGHQSITGVTDDGRFAAVLTNTDTTVATTPNREDVVDSALCGNH